MHNGAREETKFSCHTCKTPSWDKGERSCSYSSRNIKEESRFKKFDLGSGGGLQTDEGLFTEGLGEYRRQWYCLPSTIRTQKLPNGTAILGGVIPLRRSGFHFWCWRYKFVRGLQKVRGADVHLTFVYLLSRIYPGFISHFTFYEIYRLGVPKKGNWYWRRRDEKSIIPISSYSGLNHFFAII